MKSINSIDRSSYLQVLDTAKFSRFHIRAILISGTVSRLIFKL
jgi:hypothetical protein